MLKRCRFLLLWIMLLGYCPLKTYSQLKCKIEHYSTEDGLSHDWITCIFKDSEGFMWFGTWDGINRFDGHHFTAYKSVPGDMSWLKNSRIDQIAEDQSGHLWLKAYDNNIYRFSKRSEQFEPLNKKMALAGHQLYPFVKIFVTKSGDVWLSSKDGGLVMFPKSDTSLTHFTLFARQNAPANRLPSNSINFFYEDRDGNVWVGTGSGLAYLKRNAAGTYSAAPLNPEIAGQGDFRSMSEDGQSLYFLAPKGKLVLFNKKNRQLRALQMAENGLNKVLRSTHNQVLYGTTASGEILSLDPATGKVLSAFNCSLGALSSIYEDKGGNLWIAPEKGGLMRYVPSQRTFQYFTQVNDAKYNNNGDHFRITEDNNGIVWASLKGGGFGWYNAAKGKLEYFYNEPASPVRQFSNMVTDFYYDNAGILWLNTEDRGIEKITFLRNDFNQQLLVDPARFKSDNEVRGMCYDREGRLWLGAKSGKLYVYKDGKLLTGLFTNEPPEGFGLVYAIMQDKRGNIWLGTKANGLFMASPEGAKYRLSHFLPDGKDAGSISSNEIYTILEDREGRVWAGSYEGGINLVTYKNGHVQFEHAGPDFAGYPEKGFRKVRHMAQDKAGRIWIATTDGLVITDPNRHGSTRKYVTYTKIPGDKESLGNNDIQFICRDSAGEMWLATSGGGIGHAIGTDPLSALKFKNYSTKDGLSNDYVLSCAEDKHGNLWIATLNGLSKFNRDKQIFRNYNSYDGLPKAGFAEAGCARLPDHRLVFGTIKGYLLFDPDKITTRRIPGDMVFTNLQVNSRDINADTTGSVLTQNINYTSNLVLNHDQHIISIDYTVLDMRAGLKQAYAYRLRNFDQEWRNNQNQRRATYTNLPPGDYLFEVKSLSTDMYLKQPYRSLKITILPPLWRTWWAYLAYALLAGLALALARRNALTMLRLRQNIAVEKRLAELKMGFFTNVSHELRTPLMLILNPIAEIEKILKRGTNQDHHGLEYAKVIKRNAGRMVRFINQLLDLRKVQSGKAVLRVSKVELVSFVSAVMAYFNDMAREKEIELVLESSRDEIFGWIDAEKLDIVIYNVLANALKFTPAKRKIFVKLDEPAAQRKFRIAISDEGPGVPEDKLKAIFELYYEAEVSDSKYMKGTGIGLAFSKELVELHNGTITAHNAPQQGLTILIEMPSGREHFNTAQVTFTDEPAAIHIPAAADTDTPFALPPNVNKHDQGVPLLLLVEDNAELRTFLGIQLSEFYRVETAQNGAEGLKRATELLPDLILSDVMMPEMDGITMLDRLKNNDATSHIPVVILSARFSVENQIEGLRYGADYYIAKPFQNEFLLAAIQNLLRRRRQLFDGIVEQKKPVVDLDPSPLVITSKDEAFLKQVVAVVEEGMADPEFAIDDVAGSMGMGRTTFFTKFKSLTDMAPVEFVRDMRLKRGMQYLEGGETNISVIAYAVGFNNARYFSTCFKEKYKMSPSEYLKKRAEKTE